MFNSAPQDLAALHQFQNTFSAGGIGYADGGRPKVGDVSIGVSVVLSLRP